MITFTEQPHKTVENLFNNQVFEFEATDAISAEVLISNGINVRQVIIDGINGKFYLDAKKTVQSLFNIDNFADKILPTQISYLINDTSLFREFTYNFNVKLINGTIETAQKIIKYTKAVDQLTRPKEVENSTFRVMTNSNYINYYEGLPLDISIYSDITRSVTITNKKTAISVVKEFTKGVNRLFFSNGENINGFESVCPLVLNSINQLEFYEGLSQLATIEVFKHKECDAPYFKWFNSRGGWSYFRFSRIYQDLISHKNNDFLNSDFKNIEKTVGNFKTTGKEAGESIRLKSDTLQENEIPNFTDIYTSPKVYFYATLANQPMTAYSFKEVSINNGSVQLKNTKRSTNNFDVTVDMPNFYTQTYL